MGIKELISKMIRGCGITQTKLADISGIEQNLISRYALKAFMPKLGHFMKLCKACGFRMIIHDSRDDLARAEFIAEEVGCDVEKLMKAIADWEEGEVYEQVD